MRVRALMVSVAAACALLASAGAIAQCAPLAPTQPAREATVPDARPEIAWAPVPGARSYRVQIESRVPEGRVVERIDATVSATRFVPPRPLAEERAAVKVLITPDCAKAPNLGERPAWFFIDATRACASPDGLEFSPRGVEWRASRRATRYEVEVYASPEGRLLARSETPLTYAALPVASTPVLVAVRPRCGSVLGPAVYGLAPAR